MEVVVLCLGSVLVLDWRRRQQARAEVRVTIQRPLDEGLPSVYTPGVFEQKTTAVFQHVYDAYHGAGHSVYGAVGDRQVRAIPVVSGARHAKRWSCAIMSQGYGLG